MKKFFFFISFVFLLLFAFRGGTWYGQYWTGGKNTVGKEHRILHYVDPMNPANISDKPGVAPCGMPMEPVYSDGAGPEGMKLNGAVKISLPQQQIIGITVETAKRASEAHTIRVLGRISVDENQIFPLVSATDGWMSYIPASTVGSLVEKNQLMALVKIYDYDFFSWQQRFLTELANTGRRRLPATNFTGARQPLALPPAMPQTLSSPASAMMQEEHSSLRSSAASSPSGKVIPPVVPPPVNLPQANNKISLGMPFSAMASLPPSSESLTKDVSPSVSDQTPVLSAAKGPDSMVDHGDHVMTEDTDPSSYNTDSAFIREDDILYANKAKLELLNLGVGATQLDDLARNGKYVKTIEIRSPVTGLVVDRRIAPLQKVERGTECFRVADLNRVWVVADVFQDEAVYIHPGMSARISLPHQKASSLARVSDIFPPFDSKSRTLKVRLELENPDYAFRPEMFVAVEFLVTFPEVITVPAGALLDSGQKQVVYIAHEKGYFEPREVLVGWRFGDRVEIVKGVNPGEEFVSSGTFLLDSESRMNLAVTKLMKKSEAENSSSLQSTPDTPSQGMHGHD